MGEGGLSLGNITYEPQSQILNIISLRISVSKLVSQVSPVSKCLVKFPGKWWGGGEGAVKFPGKWGGGGLKCFVV